MSEAEKMSKAPKPRANSITKKHNQKEWLVMFERLKNYKVQNGHCNVPKRYSDDQRLGHWVHYQRTMFKKSNLAAERITMLEDLGFVWVERPSTGVYRGTSSWETRYEELKDFKKQHGHCRVPRDYPPNPALGRWVKWQRYNRTLLDRGESSVLDKKRIKLLNAINFSWGYQRIPPKKQHLTNKDDIEPVPYVPEMSNREVSIDTFATKTNDIFDQDARFSCSPCQEQPMKHEDPIPYPDLFDMQETHFGRETSSGGSFNARLSPMDVPSKMFCSELDGNLFRNPPNENGLVNYYGRRHSNDKNDNYLRSSFTKQEYDEIMAMNNRLDFGGFDQPIDMNNKKKSDGWRCDVCKVATFKTYDDALLHENKCSGYPGQDFFSFCQTCS